MQSVPTTAICDTCKDTHQILENYDARVRTGNGLHLSKEEIITVVRYTLRWPERQCFCCYGSDLKNLERMNAIVQVILRCVMQMIKTLPQWGERQVRMQKRKLEKQMDIAGPSSTEKGHEEGKEKQSKQTGDTDRKDDDNAVDDDDFEEEYPFTVEDRVRLLEFTHKVYVTGFPLYHAQKALNPASLEELSPHETTAMSSCCDMQRVFTQDDASAFFLRNICFICDINGMQAVQECFEQATVHNLPSHFSNHLFQLIANLRHYLNQETVIHHIKGLRSPLIRFLCSMSQGDLRVIANTMIANSVIGSSQLTDAVLSAVKDTPDRIACRTFDAEGLALALKLFSCESLSLRVAGVIQINNHLNLYNDCIACGEIEEGSNSLGKKLSSWFTENELIKKLFGPNVHVEVVRHSQIILNFMAMDGNITAQDIDCIWSCCQLKHCGRQILEVLATLLKTLDTRTRDHLRSLVSKLEPSAHNESTIFISSTLDRLKWQSQHSAVQSAAIQQQLQPHVGPYSALRSEPAGPKGNLHQSWQYTWNYVNQPSISGLTKQGKRRCHNLSSSDSEGEDEGNPRKRPLRPKIVKKKRVSLQDKCAGGSGEMESSGDEQCCDMHHHLDAHHHHNPALHEDSLGSDSSLGAQSDLSEDSVQDERIVEAAKAMDKTKFRILPQQHIHPSSGALDSEECTESSEDDEEEEEEEEEEEDDDEEEETPFIKGGHRQMRTMKKQQQLPFKRGASKNEAAAKSPKEHGGGKEEMSGEEETPAQCKKLNESSELEVYEQDHSEVDPMYSDDDDEVIKQARMVQIKSYEPGSDTSDCEEEILLHGVHMQQRQKQAGPSGLLKQAAKVGLHHGVQAEHPQVGRRSQEACLRQGRGVESQDESDPNTSGECLTGQGSLDKLPLSHLSSSIQPSGPNLPAHGDPGVTFGMEAHGSFTVIDSPDSSLNNSQTSNRSDNMRDVEGEEASNDEELVQLETSKPPYTSSHGPHQLPHMGTLYHMSRSVIHGGIVYQDQPEMMSKWTVGDVCDRGNTLIWDLCQEEYASKLPEGLKAEAEKALHSLIAASLDRRIKAQFVQACINNLIEHKSVFVSLRFLPKIFNSYQPHFRVTSDVHEITMWAETDLHMMHHFFADLIHFAETNSEASMGNSPYSYREEVQVRLNFLTVIFSITVSPDRFRLSQEQVDILWNCLALKPASSDDCLQWFLTQAKSKDHHALGLEAFRHIFLQKIPQLNPEGITMTGLNLFEYLSHLTRICTTGQQPSLTEDQICGMDQLWQIALQANNQDVSMSAIQFLNSYFLNFGGGQLQREDMFIQRSIENLMTALSKMRENPTVLLKRIHRGLILLKNHLELFCRQYAFHLRTLVLNGSGLTAHQERCHGKGATTIRILLQPTGLSEKTQLDMLSSDLVSELRAEVTQWWESLQKGQQLVADAQADQSGHGLLSPILGAMLGDGPIRLIFQGQELTPDTDDKSLGEIQLKDNVVVFVSVGASRPPKKHDGMVSLSSLPGPDRSRMPLHLLTQEPYFGNLFNLLEGLSSVESDMEHLDTQERARFQAEARRVSRLVWDLLMMLPTSPSHLEGFTHQNEEPGSGDASRQINWDRLLPPYSPHRLYYSLQIVEQLAYGKQPSRKTLVPVGGAGDMLAFVAEETADSNEWQTRFVSRGGLSHLLSIVMDGALQPNEGESWSQWNQECLAYLLRIITQFSVESPDVEIVSDDMETLDGPRKKIRRPREEKVPRLMESVLNLMNVEAILKILMQVLYEAAYPVDTTQVYICSWGRAEVVRTALALLVSVAHSCREIQGLQSATPDLTAWLKRLTLEAPEPYVRKEAAMGLYRLCQGSSTDLEQAQQKHHYLVPILSSLLSFLSDAVQFKVQKNNEIAGKEPYGPGCRDYFWLLCRLVEAYGKEESISGEPNQEIDLDGLGNHCATLVMTRQFYETRHGNEEDDGLVGLLNLLSAIFKHNMPLRESPVGRNLVKDLFDCVFKLPTTSERHFPLCKSSASRSACYDLLIEICRFSSENYFILKDLLMAQHKKDSHQPYPFDYWPQDSGRSKAGFCGMQNLGATCYMAAAIQFIFMIPEMREAILQAKVSECIRHEAILIELQKMFAFLQESERRSYNPKNFCKAYTMADQPLNIGEQKDMQEFFTDLLTKMEEMTPELKVKIKEMFRGVITNSVVSLDCPHVSRTFEEFSTIRCQVCDMKDLHASLNLLTVKDCLEGDNKYECGKCEGKVNVCAEKRACFRKLPEVLCINTMRYSFNFNTMMKEKLNSHFSFPRTMDMSSYMEHKLLGPDKMKDCDEPDAYGVQHPRDGEDASFEYKLSGVTVHTGTAEGGHYYSFIRSDLDKEDTGLPESWLLCNDAEVRPWDTSQLGVECFGGEMTSKTYDSVNDKYLDLSYEKTNSAYMLLYTRVNKEKDRKPKKYNFELSPELANQIWEDNMEYLKDRNIFAHAYYNFIWQVCGFLPTTIPKVNNAIPNNVLLQSTQLTASFVLETLIHSKEKPTMLQWIETLSKHFNKCHDACEWFLDHMADDDWWVTQIFIKCPSPMVRQLLHRILNHVISALKQQHSKLYLETGPGDDPSEVGNRSCVTRFIKKFLAILETNVRPYIKHLPEYFHFLLDFAKLGEDECLFLTRINCISTFVTFYMGQQRQEPNNTPTASSNYVEILSEDEEDEEVLPLSDDSKPTTLEKMISLISLLVEKCHDEDGNLQLSEKDTAALIGNRAFPFLLNQIREQINIRQTCNIILCLTRWNNMLAVDIVNMIFVAIRKLGSETTKGMFQHAPPFFRVLTMLVEMGTNNAMGTPSFIKLVLQKMWDLAKLAPVAVLEWLTTHVTRIKEAHLWVLDQMHLWVEHYLIGHNSVRVRNSAAYLLMSLVPSAQFRSLFRAARPLALINRECQMSPNAMQIIHKIYRHLLSLLCKAKNYVDPDLHGTTKLVCYFLILQFCVYTRTEKLMFRPYFNDLWQLFHPKLLEPQIAMHHNKQSLLSFWHMVCVECPENVELITSNSHVCKNIAFNYILADHEDQDIMLFNRMMLPSYYGLLRLCCQHSRAFTRQLALHQNIQWAFKNISPYPSQYTSAIEELYKIMRLMSTRYPDSDKDELLAINSFRRSTIELYLSDLDPRTHWQTMITAFKILVESLEDRIVLLCNKGLNTLSESFTTLHAMYHEATACHVIADIVDLLNLMCKCLKTVRECIDKKAQCTTEMKGIMLSWKERAEVGKKLLTLLNSYIPTELRTICFDVLKQMILTLQPEMISLLVPFLTQCHTTFQDNNMHSGPFFPRRGQKTLNCKTSIRPPRPQFQMMLHAGLLESMKGVDDVYDQQVYTFFIPYHQMLDTLQRLAINLSGYTENMINLGAMVAYEGVPIHSPYFAKMWNEIHDSESADPDHSMVHNLCRSRYFISYCDAVLLDERRSLNNYHIHKFFVNFFRQVFDKVCSGQISTFLDNIVAGIVSERAALKNVYTLAEVDAIFQRIGGDVRALLLLLSVLPEAGRGPILLNSLRDILAYCREDQQRRAAGLERVVIVTPSVTDSVTESECRKNNESARSSKQELLVSSSKSGDSCKTSPTSKDGKTDLCSDPNTQSQDSNKAQPGPSEVKVEEKESDGDSEMLCVDVTEASESVEVCTTPRVEETGRQAGGSSAVKRRLPEEEDDKEDQPACKKSPDVMMKEKECCPDTVDSKKTVEPVNSSSNLGKRPSGECSLDSCSAGPSAQQASPCCEASPSAGQSCKDAGHRSQRASTSSGQGMERSSSEEGASAHNSGGSPQTSAPSQKHIIDRVAVEIEDILQLMGKPSSS